MVAFSLDYFNLNQLWFSLDHIFHQINLYFNIHLYKLAYKLEDESAVQIQHRRKT